MAWFCWHSEKRQTHNAHRLLLYIYVHSVTNNSDDGRKKSRRLIKEKGRKKNQLFSFNNWIVPDAINWVMDLAGKEYFTKIDNYHIITQLPLCEKKKIKRITTRIKWRVVCEWRKKRNKKNKKFFFSGFFLLSYREMTGPNITCTGTLAIALHSISIWQKSKGFHGICSVQNRSLKAKCYYTRRLCDGETKATNVFFFPFSSKESTLPFSIWIEWWKQRSSVSIHLVYLSNCKIGITPVKRKVCDSHQQCSSH
jgi:hypothetical protein